jgi:hypothetical protein
MGLQRVVSALRGWKEGWARLSDRWDADRVAVFCVFGGRFFSPTGMQQLGFGGDYWVVPEDDPWRVTPSPQ